MDKLLCVCGHDISWHDKVLNGVGNCTHTDCIRVDKGSKKLKCRNFKKSIFQRGGNNG